MSRDVDTKFVSELARSLVLLEKVLSQGFGINALFTRHIMWVVLTLGIRDKFPQLEREERDLLRLQIAELVMPKIIVHEKKQKGERYGKTILH